MFEVGIKLKPVLRGNGLLSFLMFNTSRFRLYDLAAYDICNSVAFLI